MKGWGLFKRELAKGSSNVGVPGHHENERQRSLVDEAGHEPQFREHRWVHFSLIFEIVSDGHVGHELLCFPFLHVSLYLLPHWESSISFHVPWVDVI